MPGPRLRRTNTAPERLRAPGSGDRSEIGESRAMPRRKQQAPKRAAGKEKPSPYTALPLRSSRSFPPSLLLPRVTLAFPARSRIYFSPSPSLCPELPVPLRARGPARGSPAPTPSRRPAPAPAKLPPNFPPLSPLLPRPLSPPGSSLHFAPRFRLYFFIMIILFI